MVDFWHTNVFGGVWATIILYVNLILIFVTSIYIFFSFNKFVNLYFILVCCATTVRASTCSFVWNFITLIAFATLIVFDVIFITNPYTCILTPTCSNQTQLTSFNYVVQNISPFQSYSIYDSKKLFLQIQVGCAGLAFLISIIYVIIFLICRLKLRKRAIIDNPNAPIVHKKRGLRVAQTSTVSPAFPYAPY